MPLDLAEFAKVLYENADAEDAFDGYGHAFYEFMCTHASSILAELTAARKAIHLATKFLSDNGIMCDCPTEDHDCDWFLSATDLNDAITAYRALEKKP